MAFEKCQTFNFAEAIAFTGNFGYLYSGAESSDWNLRVIWFVGENSETC